MEIFTCHAVQLQLKPIMLSRVLDCPSPWNSLPLHLFIHVLCCSIGPQKTHLLRSIKLEMLWDEPEELAMDREEWMRCIARCADLHGKD